MDGFFALLIVATLFIGLPWVILHYVTKWKTAATITSDDEVLLEESRVQAQLLGKPHQMVVVAATFQKRAPVFD
ncbi:MAG: envelope stress response membrane protein PspB [Pseudomonadota bacterium]